jgi:hypothetical protein
MSACENGVCKREGVSGSECEEKVSDECFMSACVDSYMNTSHIRKIEH